IPICTNQGVNSANRGRCNTTEVHAQNPTLTGEAQRISRALHPRIPRYSHFETDQKRLGLTGSLQVRPFDSTLLTIDAMHATFEANRDEWEIEAISFSRARNGLPQTDIYNYEIDDEGTLIKGTFNDVDIRSEHRFDELKTEFNQLNFTWDQNWSDRFSSKVLIGSSKSQLKNPEQTTFTFESYDVDGYSYDYSDMTAPKFNYGTSSTGCTPDQACYWTYAATVPSGQPELPGDASLIRLRPQGVTNKFDTAKIDLKYDLTDNFTLKGGVSRKTYVFTSFEARRTLNGASADENASGAIATAINGDITKYSQTVSVGGNTYLIPNLDAIRSDFDYNCNCTNQWGQFTVNTTNAGARGNNRYAKEVSEGWFVQLDFRGDVAGIPYRGNIGTREVETSLNVRGLRGGTSNGIEVVSVERSYKDSLPSFNLTVEPFSNLFIRVAAAKTMARPTLLQMVPGGGDLDATSATKTVTTGNPYLDPVRANTQDLSIEWYPDRDTLVTLAFFRKDIKTYIQSVRSEILMTELGYDPLDYGLPANQTVQRTQPINTPGGELKGWELSLQKPFTFLPGILSRTGGIFNYTNVDSDIEYYTSPTATTTTREKLLGLSPKAWNTTIYYEGPQVSGRVAFAYRDSYLSALNPGSSADFWGKNETFNIDAQISYKVNNKLTFIFEGINLTNEPDDRFVAYNTPYGNTAQDLLYDYSESGRQFYLGFRYKH
ncbi:MAG: TonB-dependent receptor, partial [Asticcacaulis sp.]